MRIIGGPLVEAIRGQLYVDDERGTLLADVACPYCAAPGKTRWLGSRYHDEREQDTVCIACGSAYVVFVPDLFELRAQHALRSLR